MMLYLLVKDNIVHASGGLSDIVSSISSFDNDGSLLVKMPGYKQMQFHSYSNEWTDDEKQKDIMKFIKSKLDLGVWPKVYLYSTEAR